MTDERFEELCVDYLLGPLDPTVVHELEPYLVDSPARETRLKELSQSFHAIPLAASLEAPPSHLKAQILQQVADQEASRTPHASHPNRGRLWQVWALAASLLLALTSVWAIQLLQRTTAQRDQIGSLSSEVELLRNRSQGLQIRVDELTDPRTRFLSMAGLTGFEGASGSAFLFPDDGKARLYLHDLPALAQNQAFQLWVIEEGQAPRPSQVFQPSGHVTEFEIDLPLPADHVQILAVTIEPAGGSPAPTGSMVLAGQFQAG